MLGKFKKPESKDFSGMTKNDAIQVASKLARVEGDKYSGWKEFVLLLDDYVATVLKNKNMTDLNSVSDAVMQQLKLFDRDAWLIENIIKPMPMNFVKGLDRMLKEEMEKEANKEDESANNQDGT